MYIKNRKFTGVVEMSEWTKHDSDLEFRKFFNQQSYLKLYGQVDGMLRIVG
jgi:hypothetical protein